ncbi:MAG: hypothetical protein KatS3mg051_1932 [Anaerolineae bacterium]|nr:MAG: hypothetical protein KatS3mg051_1932 [Anaerolineae bacterium]
MNEAIQTVLWFLGLAAFSILLAAAVNYALFSVWFFFERRSYQKRWKRELDRIAYIQDLIVENRLEFIKGMEALRNLTWTVEGSAEQMPASLRYLSLDGRNLQWYVGGHDADGNDRKEPDDD